MQLYSNQPKKKRIQSATIRSPSKIPNYNNAFFITQKVIGNQNQHIENCEKISIKSYDKTKKIIKTSQYY